MRGEGRGLQAELRAEDQAGCAGEPEQSGSAEGGCAGSPFGGSRSRTRCSARGLGCRDGRFLAEEAALAFVKATKRGDAAEGNK